MRYDADTWVGHWPFRALPRKRVTDLLHEMDRHGIDKAMTGNLHGLFYMDAHESNHELAREARAHRDRIVPCAVLNPVYEGWIDDLRQCRESFEMPVLRLAPDYHGYTFADPLAAEIVHAASELGMWVAFSWRITDPRGTHRLDPGREMDSAAVAAFTSHFPEGRFMLLNFRDVPATLQQTEKQQILFDTALLMGDNGLRLERMVAAHGATRFVLGSTMLMRGGSAACLALDKARISETEREAIAWRNLAHALPQVFC